MSTESKSMTFPQGMTGMAIVKLNTLKKYSELLGQKLHTLIGRQDAEETRYLSLNPANHNRMQCPSEQPPQTNAPVDITSSQDPMKETQLHHSVRSALNEMAAMHIALDAHAIVVVTDAKGIIERVNEKFCEISKYKSNELIGKTHGIVKSSHHPEIFFQDMWKTISSGAIWSGEICNCARDGSTYWTQTTIVPCVGEDGVPYQYMAIKSDITARKSAEQDALRLASSDALTGLGNRKAMIDRLELSKLETQANGQFCALLFLDLDDFKRINETLGHKSGDLLLCHMSKRLQKCVRDNDVVTRLGGDEFAIFLSNLGHDRERAAERVRETGLNMINVLSKAYLISQTEISTTTSAGAVLYTGSDVDVLDLFRNASLALFEAKAAGGSQVHIFEDSLFKKMMEFRTLEADLRSALEKDQYQLHYQPIVDAAGKTVGTEALLRWTHPTHGAISPMVFIPMAEKTGLIVLIGKWVFEKACEQLLSWSRDVRTAHWTVSVNISARQLHSDTFVQDIIDATQRIGVNPAKIRLELTESSLVQDLAASTQKMETLRAMGFQFSLDDFGTGYSSLSYLKKLPLDWIKIDKSFVENTPEDHENASIVTTILALARGLNMQAVVEGVETKQQFDFLAEQGCQLFQGYFFGKPALPEALQFSSEGPIGTPPSDPVEEIHS